MKLQVKLRYTSIDHYVSIRRYSTLEGAQRYAQQMVGETPEISQTWGYAVSADGVGKVEVEGVPLIDLFPKLKENERVASVV